MIAPKSNLHSFKAWYHDLSQCLQNLIITQKNRPLSENAGFSLLASETLNARHLKKKIIFIGNGASASMASHISADLGKNGQIRTQVFTDLSLVTACANDINSASIFSTPLAVHADPGDILLAISSSGNSPNILNACFTARQQGMTIFTFSAMRKDNSLRKLGDLNFYVPTRTYGMAETAHASLLHYWVDTVLDEIEQEETHTDESLKHSSYDTSSIGESAFKTKELKSVG